MRSNRSEDLLLFRDRHDFGKNKGNTRSKPLFLENTNIWESLPRALNFEYPKNKQLYANGLFPFTFLLK